MTEAHLPQVVRFWPYTTAYLCVMVTVSVGLLATDVHVSTTTGLSCAPVLDATKGTTMGVFADTASWGLILGVLTPLLVSVVQQPQWPSQARAVISLVASVIVGIITVLATGDISDTTSTLGVLALVFVASNTAYKTFWKPTKIAPVIEMKTSPRSASRPEQHRAA